MLRAALRPLAYPVCLGAAIAAYLWFHNTGLSLKIAPYLAVLLAFVLIAIFEALIPYRRDWKPGLTETVTDFLFMAVVQVALPLGLGWLSVYAISHFATTQGLSMGIWPVTWPVWAQVLLKIVIGDFLRYWLHRWSHKIGWLWRLHEVHHAPQKLYALNVFRFHPLDKALQFICDGLLFIWLGVGPEVLALYFVIYATSGLLQHANIDLRLGLFNYVLSGPEVHRWHHDEDIATSSHNFSHTFIVWDLVFGTYYRPKDRSVDRIGVGFTYPENLLRQFWAPFARRR